MLAFPCSKNCDEPASPDYPSSAAVMRVFPKPPEEIFSGMVKVLFYGLKTIGLAPFSIEFKTLTTNSRNTSIKVFLFSRMGLLYNLVLATLIQIAIILAIPILVFSDEMKRSSVKQALKLLTYILHAATAVFIVVYLALRQKRSAIIMNRLLDVYSMLYGAKERLFNKGQYIFLFGQMAFHIFLLALVISFNVAFNSLSVLLICSVNLLVYFFDLEYSYILRVVAREFEVFNQNLSKLNDFPSYLFLPSLAYEHPAILSSPTRDQLATLKLLHGIRTTLSELSQEIADFFSLPVLLSITCGFVSLIQGSHFSISTTFMRTSDVSIRSYVAVIMWIFICAFPLIILASNVTATVKQARLTGRIVHALLARAKKEEIISELEQFSLQLIHEHVSFTACGFFKLDFTMLQSIVGATVTYLVIVFQFTESTKNEY